METNKTTVVGEEFRTNPLSLTPGGSNIEVVYSTRSKIYTNIKNPKAYVNRITDDVREPITDILVDGIKYTEWLKG
jgi:hypothetical protein